MGSRASGGGGSGDLKRETGVLWRSKGLRGKPWGLTEHWRENARGPGQALTGSSHDDRRRALLSSSQRRHGHLVGGPRSQPHINTVFINVLLPGFLLNFWIHYSQIAAICLQSKIFFPLPYHFEIH